MQVVLCRDPVTAKGLFLSAVRDPNPVIFMEPKALYRASVAEVPVEDYTIPLGEAEVIREGTDVTVVGWGQQVHVLNKVWPRRVWYKSILAPIDVRLCEWWQQACEMAEEEGISCELIDLRTVLPWDFECVANSVTKTGRLVVSCEAPVRALFAHSFRCGSCVCKFVNSRCVDLLLCAVLLPTRSPAALQVKLLLRSKRSASCAWSHRSKEYVATTRRSHWCLRRSTCLTT